MTTTFEQLCQQITKHHICSVINPHLLQMLKQGLLVICNDTPELIQLEHYPAELHPLCSDQQRIGWDQLFYGRFAVSWATYLEHFSGYKINGTIFYAKITVTI